MLLIKPAKQPVFYLWYAFVTAQPPYNDGSKKMGKEMM
jgi:hypothetical protein